MRRMDELHLEFPFAGARMLQGLLAVAAGRIPPSPRPATGSIRICCVALRSIGRTRCGRWANITKEFWGVAAERRPLEDVARPLTFIKMTPWDVLRYHMSIVCHDMKFRPEANRMIICSAILPTLSIGQLDCRNRHPCETRPSSLGTISHPCRCRARHHLDS